MGRNNGTAMRYLLSRNPKRLITAALSALVLTVIGAVVQAAVQPVFDHHARQCTVYPAELAPRGPGRA